MKKQRFATSHLWAIALGFTGLGNLATTAHAQSYTAVNVKFDCQKLKCDGDLWLPKGISKPPIILMAHGVGAEKDWGLAPFAEAFVKAGFAVYRFNYRGFGLSEGKPRNLVDGKAHLKDWASAVDAMKARTDVDGSRMGIWGSSFSGGHVLALAAQRPNDFKAVSSQVPFVNGLQSSLKFPIKYQPQALWYGLRDLMRSDDEAPITVPLASKEGFAVMVCDECDHYKDLVPANRRDNLVTPARVLMTLPWYFPTTDADKIKAPTLLIAGEKDGLVPISGVRSVAKAIPNVTYVELKGVDHFQPYFGELLQQDIARQTVFFKQHL